MDELEREEREALAKAEKEREANIIAAKERELKKLAKQVGHEIELPEIPEGASFEEIAEALEQACLMALAEIALNPHNTAASRVSAANSVIDRSRGKPLQDVKVTHENADFKAMMAEMLEMRKGVYIPPDKIIDSTPGTVQ